MSKNIDKSLEMEIGSIGGETTEQATGLGKLTHKSAYGQKEDLNKEEQDSLNKFLNKGKAIKDDFEAAQISQGWIPINREEMGSRSMFYPSEWDFFVKPATMQAIKNWTAIDESRPDQVNKVFDEIVKQCVKIDTHAPQGACWAQINSWDRFWFILKVREYTFTTGEAKIEFDDECKECGQNVMFELTPAALHYEFPDESLVESYWNGSEWEIDPSEYDVEYPPLKLYTPKLGKDSQIIDWAVAKQRDGGKIDETFIEFLVWMIEKPSKDMNIFDHQVQKIYKEYKSWSVDMFTFMRDVIRNITINPSENLAMRCPHCGQETISGVRFPDGINKLFGTGKAKKFGTR